MPEICASVDPNIIRELPRFFGSWVCALGELLQNAYRAGAGKVDMMVDKTSGLLSITDDGAGMEEPGVLLRAGASGWNGTVVDPAGLGFFAHLAFVTQTCVTSGRPGRRWRLTLTPEILSGGPATWENVTATEAQSGTRIELTLKPGAIALKDEEVEETVRSARAYYPFRLTLNGRVIEPRSRFQPLLTVETPAGPAKIGPRPGAYRGGFHAVWEHRVIGSEIGGSSAFQNGMQAAAKKCRRPMLAKELMCLHWEWFVSPDCGVRPRLPERSELIDNEALKNACGSLLDAVVTIVEKAITGAGDLPDKIGAMDDDLCKQLGGGLLPKELITGIWHTIWEELIPGYVRVSWNNPTDFECWYRENNGIMVRRLGRYFYTRRAVLTSSSDLEQTLNLLGHDTSFIPGAVSPRVIIRGLRQSNESPDVALAESIEVEGIGSIPFILKDVEEERAEAPYAEDESGRPLEVEKLIVYAGSPEEFIRVLEGGDERFSNAFFLARHYLGDEWEWCDVDGEDVSISHGTIREELIEQVTKGFRADRLQATERYFKTNAAVDRVRTVREDLSAATKEIAHPFMSDKREIEDLLETAATNLRKAERLVLKECTRLRKEAGMASSEEAGGVPA
ncbi:MAG: ATP-binding protein [Nitrospirae bacterium]|nr:ATP-binding protein [Nitrospirota bacterium]